MEKSHCKFCCPVCVPAGSLGIRFCVWQPPPQRAPAPWPAPANWGTRTLKWALPEEHQELKRAVKASLGDKFILAPRTLQGWEELCRIGLNTFQVHRKPQVGIDALWCPSGNFTPNKSSSSPKIFSPMDKAVCVSSSVLLEEFSLFKQMLTHHREIKTPLDIATLQNRPHYSGRVAINWFPQILLNSGKAQRDGKDKADLNNNFLK